MCAACVALLSSSLIGAFLPVGTLDDQAIEGLGILTVYVWIYCLIWFLVQDVFKVVAYRILRRFHILGYGKPFVMAGIDADAVAAPAPEPTEVVVHH